MEQPLPLLLLVISSTIVAVTANHSDTSQRLYDVQNFLVANGILKEYEDEIKTKRCSSPFLCWPGKCFMVAEQQFCICPTGFSFESGRCINESKNCSRNLNCHPGVCSVRNGWNSCLCPEGYYSERGMCKEFQWNCRLINCKPGKCINEFNREKCLCPEGYTAKNGRCLEIAYTSSAQISTIMMLIIVALASVMITAFFGVCICYYTHRNSQ